MEDDNIERIDSSRYLIKKIDNNIEPFNINVRNLSKRKNTKIVKTSIDDQVIIPQQNEDVMTINVAKYSTKSELNIQKEKSVKSGNFNSSQIISNKKNIKFDELNDNKNPFEFLKIVDNVHKSREIERKDKIKNNQISKKDTLQSIEFLRSTNNLTKITHKGYWAKTVKMFEMIIHSKVFTVVFTIAIIIALFLHDIAIIFMPKSWDHSVEFCILGVFFFFVVEFVFSSIFIKSFRFSFFFFTDLLAICGLIPDINIFFTYSDHHEEFVSELETDLLSIFLGNSHMSKSIRVTTSGSRVGRIFTLLNILGTMSIFQLGKLYRSNIDNFLKNNESLMQEKRQKEKIRLMRRNTLRIGSMKDRMKFFNQVHNVINTKTNNIHNVSQINPIILKNFYDYAMKNEKKHSLVKNENDLILQIKNPVNINKTINGESEEKMTLNNYYKEKKYNNPDNKKADNKRKSTIKLIQGLAKNFKSIIQEKEVMFKQEGNWMDNKLKYKNKFQLQQLNNSQAEINNKDEPFNSVNLSSHMDKTIDSNLTKIKFCKCPQKLPIGNPHVKNLRSGKLKHVTNFSLISKDILTKIHFEINKIKKEKKRNSYSHPEKEILDTDTRRYSTPSESSAIKFSGINNPSRKCEVCDGIDIKNPLLDQTVHTYVNKEEIKSKYSSSVMDENEFYQRGSIVPYFINGKKFNSDKIKNLDQEKAQPINAKLNLMTEKEKSPKDLLKGKTFKRTVNFNFDHDQFNYIVEELDSPIQKTTIEHKNNLTINSNKKRTTNKSIIKLNQPDISNKTQSSNLIENYKLNILNDQEMINISEYTKIALSVSKAKTVKLVCLILLILFILPYLDSDKFIDYSNFNGYDYELFLLENYIEASDSNFFIEKVNQIILNQTNREIISPNLIAFGFNNRAIMCQFKNLCDVFPNETIFKDAIEIERLRADDKIYLHYKILFLIYKNEQFGTIDAILQISKIIFVTILLWLGAFLFLKDANEIVVVPLEETYKTIKETNFKQENFLCETYELPNLEMNSFGHEDIIFIQKSLIKFQKLLINRLGLRSFNFLQDNVIINTNNYNHTDNKKCEENSNSNSEASNHDSFVYNNNLEIERVPFFKLNGVILLVEISNYDLLCTENKENIVKIISRIIEIAEYTSFENFGEILCVDQFKILLFWDTGNEYKIQTSNSDETINPNFSSQSESFDINASYSISGVKKDITDDIAQDSNFTHKIENINYNESLNVLPTTHENNNHSTNPITALPDLKFKTANHEDAYTFALITAIKLTSRIRNDKFLSKLIHKVKKRDNVIQKDVEINLIMTITKGSICNFITNNSQRIESVYSGAVINQAMTINKQMKMYNLNIILTDKVYLKLDRSLRKFTRKISFITKRQANNKNQLYQGNLYTFDFDFNKPHNKNPYMQGNSNFNKNNSILVRKELIELMNEKMFQISNFIRTDPEIIFAKLKDRSFFYFFQGGLEHYEKSNYYEAITYFNKALIFKSDDYLTKFLLDEISIKMNGYK